MLTDYLEETQRLLKSDFKQFSVVVMPDFFHDRLINLDRNFEAFSGVIKDVSARKGGSIDGIKQTDLRGGNAINTASALAALGIDVTPIACTSKLGVQLIRFYLKPRRLNLSHIKILEQASITTALEFETEKGKTNVMLRDVGALADFGPHHLDSDDFGVIEQADYVCVFNWAGTRCYGTELAKTVFSHAKNKGRGKTYYDTADPTPNKEKIPELLRNVLRNECVDILSVNENEAIRYASQLGCEAKKLGKRLRFEELARESARFLARHLSARVDLHTTSFSSTLTKRNETAVPAFQVPILRATGAGDAWNAGNVLGDALGLSDGYRLTLANAVAACYISDPYGKHPTRKQIIRFFSRMKRKEASRQLTQG